MPELQVIARHTTVDGQRDAVFAVLPKLIAASRKEPGNLAFEAYLNMDDPRSYVLLERYSLACRIRRAPGEPAFQGADAGADPAQLRKQGDRAV